MQIKPLIFMNMQVILMDANNTAAEVIFPYHYTNIEVDVHVLVGFG